MVSNLSHSLNTINDSPLLKYNLTREGIVYKHCSTTILGDYFGVARNYNLSDPKKLKF